MLQFLLALLCAKSTYMRAGFASVNVEITSSLVPQPSKSISHLGFDRQITISFLVPRYSGQNPFIII